MGPVGMEVQGEAVVDSDRPCEACGNPLESKGETRDCVGIWCDAHGVHHIYHTECLSPSTQVELMLAKMKGEGMLDG